MRPTGALGRPDEFCINGCVVLNEFCINSARRPQRVLHQFGCVVLKEFCINGRTILNESASSSASTAASSSASTVHRVPAL